MNHTLISTKDLQTGQELDVIKNGNKYSLWFKYNDEIVKRDYDDFGQVKLCYEFMVSLFIKGWYTFEERKDMMNDNYDLPF